jgi:hypothetical protein
MAKKRISHHRHCVARNGVGKIGAYTLSKGSHPDRVCLQLINISEIDHPVCGLVLSIQSHPLAMTWLFCHHVVFLPSHARSFLVVLLLRAEPIFQIPGSHVVALSSFTTWYGIARLHPPRSCGLGFTLSWTTICPFRRLASDPSGCCAHAITVSWRFIEFFYHPSRRWRFQWRSGLMVCAHAREGCLSGQIANATPGRGEVGTCGCECKQQRGSNARGWQL